MRKRFILAAVAACLALLTAVDAAQAQISFGMGRGWGGRDSYYIGTPYGGYARGPFGGERWYVGSPGFGYGRGYYSPYGGYGYGRWGYPGYGYGRGWDGYGYYPSSGFSVSVGSPTYFSSPGYGYSYPSYTVSSPVVQSGYSTTGGYVIDSGGRSVQPGYVVERGSAPAVQPSPNRALVRLTVPNADADVWFEGTETQQKGFQRVFATPELEPGKRYTYKVKARWMENGKEMTQEKDVTVEPGREVALALGERQGREYAERGDRAGERRQGEPRTDVDAQPPRPQRERPPEGTGGNVPPPPE
jgi:uncharacterized protein (TIGR03000 family)